MIDDTYTIQSKTVKFHIILVLCNPILQVRRRQGVMQPKVAPGNVLWNAPLGRADSRLRYAYMFLSAVHCVLHTDCTPVLEGGVQICTPVLKGGVQFAQRPKQ